MSGKKTSFTYSDVPLLSTSCVIFLPQLQSLLCEKDSSVAEVELELRQALDSGNREKKQVLTHLHQLQGERNKLARQLKEKVRERFTLYREDSEEILGAVAREYQDYSRDEVRTVAADSALD